MSNVRPEAAFLASLSASLLHEIPMLLQDVSVEGGPGALALLRDANTGCLHLTSFHLDLDLFLRFAID